MTAQKSRKTIPPVKKRVPDAATIAEIKRVAGLTKEPLAKAKKLLAEAEKYGKFGDFGKTTWVCLNANDDEYWDIQSPELVDAIHALVKDWHAKKAGAARDEAAKLLKELQI